jgi:hypothetical protein
MPKAARKNEARQPPKHDNALVPLERIEQAVYRIRGQRAMLDTDLAAFYGVATRALNQAVKRNRERFPLDFCFQVTRAERDELITNCDNLDVLKYSRTMPFAFTEHGAIMAATVLRSEHAIQISVLVVRAFVRLRHILAEHRELARRIEALEREFTHKTAEHDAHIARIYGIIDDLMNPSAPPKKGRIGFAG